MVPLRLRLSTLAVRPLLFHSILQWNPCNGTDLTLWFAVAPRANGGPSEISLNKALVPRSWPKVTNVTHGEESPWALVGHWGQLNLPSTIATRSVLRASPTFCAATWPLLNSSTVGTPRTPYL